MLPLNIMKNIASKEVRSCYFQSYKFFLTSSADPFQYPDMEFKKKIGVLDLLRPLSTPSFLDIYIGNIRENEDYPIILTFIAISTKLVLLISSYFFSRSLSVS